MTVKEFEKAVWTREGIRIVIRATANSQVEVERYGYAHAADRNLSISQLIANRIQLCVGDREVVVIGGDGAPAHGRIKLEGLRKSYHQGQG